MLLYQTLEGSAWLEIAIDTDALTIEVEGDDDNRWGPYESWDALCDAYPSVFDAICEPHGGPEELDDATPMDLRAVRARAERRSRVVMDRSAWNQRWERARRVLLDTPLADDARKRIPKYHRKDADLTPEGLADSLTYVVEIEAGDDDPAIGASKLGGLPDLPPDAEWPEVEGHATALILQVSLAELAAVDASQQVRSEGVLQLFANAYGHGTVRYWDVPLERRACAKPPQYLEDWIAEETPISFVPGFYFQQHTGDTGGPFAVTRALPDELLSELSEALGGARPSDCFGGNRIFGGDPVDWQAMGTSYLSQELFCQICFGEGHVSVGIHEADLWSLHFADAVVGYCGT